MEEKYEEEETEKKKFQITRGMAILAAIILIVIIVVIIIVVRQINKNKPEYTTEDFQRLEERMEEEAQTYVSQKNIELTSEDYKIDLDDLLVENGGFIDPDSVKAAKVCKGYVIAKKEETESYNAYIKCGKMYTTTGYVSNNKKTTTTKKEKKDTEKPVITIIGNDNITINQGSNYKDEGATAKDNKDGDITSKIKVENNVDTSKVGSYTVVYTVTDEAGNRSSKTRKVTVVGININTTTTKRNNNTTTKKRTTTQKRVTTTTSRITTPPTITLRGDSYITLNQGDRYNDPGYYATDAKGNDITSRVSVSGSVNTSVAGTYTIRYTVTDTYGNSSSKTRTVRVISTYVAVSSISITPNTVTLSVGATRTLSVLFNPSNATNKSISWSSSNASVATVSNGVITARKAGTATITASAADGKKAYVSVIVR